MFGVGVGLLIYAIVSVVLSYSDNSPEESIIYIIVGIAGIVCMIIGKIRIKSKINSKRMSHFRCNVDDPVQFVNEAKVILRKKGYEGSDVWEKKAFGRDIYSYIKIECSDNTADIYGWIIGPGGEQMTLDGFVGGLYKAPVKSTIKKILSNGRKAKKVSEKKQPLMEATDKNNGQISLYEAREAIKEYFSKYDGEYYDIPIGGVGVVKLNHDESDRWYPLKCTVDYTKSTVIVDILVGKVFREQESVLTNLIDAYKRTKASDAVALFLRDDPDHKNVKKFSVVKIREFEIFKSSNDLQYAIADTILQVLEITKSPEFRSFVDATSQTDSL